MVAMAEKVEMEQKEETVLFFMSARLENQVEMVVMAEMGEHHSDLYRRIHLEEKAAQVV